MVAEDMAAIARKASTYSFYPEEVESHRPCNS
jgi:hypothetical protein